MTDPALPDAVFAADRGLASRSREDLHLILSEGPANGQSVALVGHPGDGKVSSVRRSMQMLDVTLLEVDMDGIQQSPGVLGGLSEGASAHLAQVIDQVRRENRAAVLLNLPDQFPPVAARQLREELTGLEDAAGHPVALVVVTNQAGVDAPAFRELTRDVAPLVLAAEAETRPVSGLGEALKARMTLVTPEEVARRLEARRQGQLSTDTDPAPKTPAP
jgi:hypothetical protein